MVCRPVMLNRPEPPPKYDPQFNPEGSKVPNYGVGMVSLLGIVIIVWGI